MTTQQILNALQDYIPFANSLLTTITVIFIALLLKPSVQSLFRALESRVQKGDSVKTPWFELEGAQPVRNTDEFVASHDKANKEKPQVTGNPDSFQLLFKVESRIKLMTDEGNQTLKIMSKSTKAMQVAGGCLIQVSTEYLNPDRTRSVAEALTFVPGVKIMLNDPNDPKKGGYLSANT